MATSPSPSASLATGDERSFNRQNEPPATKREKKRNQLADKIDELVRAFSKNKDAEYRTQLQAVQIDTSIILAADAYGTRILDEHAEEVMAQIMGYRGGDPEDIRRQLQDFGNIQFSGKIFDEFKQEIEKAAEERDANLTILNDDYSKNVRKLQIGNRFLHDLAEKEHKALSSTLRDRLINNLQARKNRLTRDKESTEVNEINASHLYPSQYTITNPSSPGGLHGKRATRHRREMEEALPGYSDSKRKRKAVDDAGSPVPTRRLIDPNGNHQIWTSGEIIRSSSDGVTPLYSIDKLFTDKELQMSYNTAAVAAQEYITRHKLNMDADADAAADEEPSPDQDGEAGGTSTPAALGATMERQVSHATRSTRGANPNIIAGGIEAVQDMYDGAYFARMASQLPKIPASAILNSQQYRSWHKTMEQRVEPAASTVDDVAKDAIRMAKAIELSNPGNIGANLYDAELNDKELLNVAAAGPDSGIAPVSWLRAAGPGSKGKSRVGGEPMARIDSGSSAGGVRRR